MPQQRMALDTLTRQSRRTQRKGQTRRTTVFALYAILAALACVCGVLAWRIWAYRAARTEYAQYQSIAETTTAPLAQAAEALPASTAPPPGASLPTPQPFYSGKVSVLMKDNSDTVGWLDIIGTDMQYPVVQGADNAYYMTHTFKKKKNDSGAIFMDCWNAPDFSDFNTVIYGHNMKDGSMFSGLRAYQGQDFADKRSVIEVTLLRKKLRYHVFAAYVSQGEDSADFRGQGCATEAQRSAFIKAARKRAVILSNLPVSRSDRLLTLVTCTSGTHPWYWVVHAVLVEEELQKNEAV